MLVNEMIIFYYVVQLKSFSQAALKLGVSKSYISKRISMLEQDLKIRLLNRNTRQVSLTNEGEIFYIHCQNMFEEAQDGYNIMANIQKQPAGTLKISVPPAFALHVLHRPLAEFGRQYPGVRLNINMDNSIENIIENGYDLAFRSSSVLPDSSLIAIPLTNLKSILCASPAYLTQYGSLKNPKQLSEHKIAAYSGSKLIYELKFTQENKTVSVIIDPYIQSNSLDLILHMVHSGACMAVFPEFMVQSALKEKKLVACLPTYNIDGSQLYAIYPNKSFVPLRVKAFIELLKIYLTSVF